MYTKAATILALGGLLSTASAQLYGASSGSSTSAAAAPAAAASTSSSAPQPSQSGMHIVSVSNAGGTVFAFNPSTITAAKGDMVQFQFNPLNHSVVQGSFEKPCQPLSGGFFSGFQSLSTGATSMPSFTITVNSTDPIWFYCSQTVLTHCQQGMVGVINPTSDQTFDMFQTAAKKTTNSISPPKAQGGVAGTVQAASSSSSSSSASPSASASSAASAANSLSLGISPVSILCMFLSVAIGGLFVAGMV